MTITSSQGVVLYGTHSGWLGSRTTPAYAGDTCIYKFSMRPNLSPGDWFVELAVAENSMDMCDVRSKVIHLAVTSEASFDGLVQHWHTDSSNFLVLQFFGESPLNLSVSPSSCSPRERREWYSTFVFAAVIGDIATIASACTARGMLGDGFDVDAIAAANGQVGVLRSLEEAGCDMIDIASQALVLAAANGHVAVVRYLHELGCDLRADDEAAIQAAAEKARLPVCSICTRTAQHQVVHRGGSVARAVAEGKICYRLLASHGVNPWGPRALELLRAIRHGTLDDVRKNFTGRRLRLYVATCLSRRVNAAIWPSSDFCISNGCDLSAQDDLALRMAAEHGHLRLIDYLHNNGGDLHAKERTKR